jgi:predicted RNase H-like HicB family nuclease
VDKYSFNIIWSDEDENYIATVPEFNGLSAHGDTPEEAIEEANVALEGFLEVFKEDGCEVPEPHTFSKFSGQTRIRLPKSLHANLAMQADREGVSLNAYMVHLLSENHVKHQIEKLLKENQTKTTFINVPREDAGLMPVKRLEKYIVQASWDDEEYIESKIEN